jgi:carboxypeptidase PM20D1
MLRGLFTLLVIIVPVLGYMTYRTADLVRPEATVIVAMPHERMAPFKLEDAAAHLGQAIRQQTIAGPDGEPLDPAVFTRFGDWLAATYPKFHAAAPREAFGYSYLYTWKGLDASSPPILLIGHVDVADYDHGALAQWSVDPFGGAIKDGYVWGRGAQLGKSTLISLMEAAEALAAAGFRPRRTVYIALGQDEDVRGEKGAVTIAAELKRRHVKAWFAIDEGQVMLTQFAMTGKPVALIGVTEKQELQLRVTASAPPSAASVGAGAQAVTTLARALIALDAMPMPGKVTDQPMLSTMRALAHDMPLESAFAVANAWAFEPLIMMQMKRIPGGEATIVSTISPTELSSGGEKDIRPGEASAILNVRLHPQDPPDAFLARVRKVIGAYRGVRAEWVYPPDPPIPISSVNSDAYHLIATLARRAAGGATAAPLLYIGSTDARHYQDVADDVYRLTPAVWTPNDIRTVLGVDERISFVNLDRMIRFYEQLISEAAG